MKKSNIIGVIVAVIVIAGVAVTAIVYGNNSVKKTSSSTASTNTNVVTIKGYAFDPTSITVKAGTKVTWTNNDSVTHTVTSDEGSADTFKSGDISQNASYSYTFNKVGTFTYHCAFHPSMIGKVTVTQ